MKIHLDEQQNQPTLHTDSQIRIKAAGMPGVKFIHSDTGEMIVRELGSGYEVLYRNNPSDRWHKYLVNHNGVS